jgi:hypothetical protein
MEKDLVGSGSGLILKYYPGHSPGGTEENHEKLKQDSRSPGSRFEPGTSRIRNRMVNHSTMTFGNIPVTKTVFNIIF